MGTAIIPHGTPRPILDPPEHDLDFVALFVEGFIVAALCRSVLARRDTRCDPLLLQGGNEPIGIIAAVGNQLFRLGKAGQEESGARVIAGVPCCQQQVHGLPPLIAHGVQLRIQPPFLYGQYSEGLPLFEQAGRRSVGLQMGRVNHQAGSGPGLSRQLAEDLVQDPRPTPAHKPVVEHLVRPIRFRGIFPLQAIPDDRDDSANQPSIIHPRDTVRQGEIGLDPVQLLRGQQKLVTHGHLQP